MNQNNNNNNGSVTPYRATGNLNTAINNPRVNINDTMNVNIQSMATNTVPVNNQNIETNINTQVNNQIPIQNNVNYNANNVQNVPLQNNYTQTNQTMVNRTYVTTDNKPKKKKLSSSLGPEFKIALLIIVILLVFIFLLPVISDLLGGY